MEVSAILLAGGKSSRFGRDKTTLDYNGRPLAAELALRLGGVFDEVLLVDNQQDKFGVPGVREIRDVYPGRGPLGGIHAGLLKARWDLCFVAAADMPCLNAEAAANLIRLIDDWDAVVPNPEGRPQPLFAVYKKRLAPVAESLILQDRLAVRDFLQGIRVLYVSGEEWNRLCPASAGNVFYNINYPGDYEQLRKQKGGIMDAADQR